MDAKAYSRAFDILHQQRRRTTRIAVLSLTGAIFAVLGFMESGDGAHFSPLGDIFPLLVKIFAGALSFGVGWVFAAIFWYRHASLRTKRAVEIWKSTTGGKLSGTIGSAYLEMRYRGDFQRLPLCTVRGVLVDGATLIVDFGDRLGMLVFALPNTSEVLELLKDARANPPASNISPRNEQADVGPHPTDQLPNPPAKGIEFPLNSGTMGRAFRVLYRHNLKTIRTISVYSISSIAAFCAFLFTGNESTLSLPESTFSLFVKILSGAVAFGATWALLTFAWNRLVNRHAARAIARWESVTGGQVIGKINGDHFEVQGAHSGNRYPLAHVQKVLTDSDILIVEMNELWSGMYFYLPNTPEISEALEKAKKRSNEPADQPMAVG